MSNNVVNFKRKTSDDEEILNFVRGKAHMLIRWNEIDENNVVENVEIISNSDPGLKELTMIQLAMFYLQAMYFDGE